MKPVVIVGALAVLSLAANWYFFSELKQERARSTEVMQSRSRAEGELSVAREELESLKREQSARHPAPSPADKEADATTRDAPANMTPTASSQAPPKAKATSRMAEYAFRAPYYDLVNEWELSGARRDEVVELLGLRRLQTPEERRAGEARLSQMLSYQQMSRLESYEKTLGARIDLHTVRSQLAGSDPLSREQERRLLTAFIDEHEAIPPPQRSAASSDADAERQRVL